VDGAIHGWLRTLVKQSVLVMVFIVDVTESLNLVSGSGGGELQYASTVVWLDIAIRTFTHW